MIDLSINIRSAENEDSLNKILNHIVKEITLGSDYRSYDIENNLKTKDGWAEINSKQIKGKYNWRKINK